MVGQDSVFVGRFDVSIDGAGAFVLPGEWRSLFDDSHCVYLMPDVGDKCLTLIPSAVMEKELVQMRTNPTVDAFAVSQIQQDMCRICVDDTFRVELPAKFRSFAGIVDSATLCGAFRFIKITACGSMC